jgi:hypothetical protein
MARAKPSQSRPAWSKGADGVWEVRLVLANAEQFYHSLDPSPFRDRDLDRDAAAFIVEEVEELPKDEPVRLVLSVPADSLAPMAQAPQAIRHYFERLAESTARQLRRMVRLAGHSLIIGMMFVFVVIAVARVLLEAAGEHTLLSALLEGLTIVAWVALWRPTEMFLYDWWPVRARVRLYRRVANLPVVVEPR